MFARGLYLRPAAVRIYYYCKSEATNTKCGSSSNAAQLSSEAGYVVARLWILRLQLPVLVQKDFISIIILALAKSIASNVHPRSEILHTYHLAIDLNDKVSNMQSLVPKSPEN